MRPAEQSALAYPFNTVLGSQAGVRVLRALARHGGALSAPTVARQAALSAAVARTALSSLAHTGIVTVHGQGRAVSYQLDATHPLAPSLAHLFAAEGDRRARVLDGLREAASRLRPEPLGLWLYGSVARGDDTETSDLDVALCVADAAVLDAHTATLRDAAAEIGQRERVPISVISFTAVDAARLAREGAAIWRGIVHDGVLLAGRSPDAVAPLAPAKSARARRTS